MGMYACNPLKQHGAEDNSLLKTIEKKRKENLINLGEYRNSFSCNSLVSSERKETREALREADNNLISEKIQILAVSKLFQM